MNLKQYIIELSKKYAIVTSLTSFVAIEKREKVRYDYCRESRFERSEGAYQTINLTHILIILIFVIILMHVIV